MSNLIGAIKIVLDQLYTEISDLGLYDATGGGHSELRWSEKPLYNITEEYNHQYIIKNGIATISSGIDIRIGGNNVSVNDFTLSVKGLNQLILKLNELKIQLSGKTIIYYEFEGSDIDSDSVGITQMFTGTIENIEYNGFETNITAKSSFALKRNSCLGKTITTSEYEYADEDIVGKNMPVTFGRSNPDESVYFKLPRIEYVNEIIKRVDFAIGGDMDNLSLFGVVNDTFINPSPVDPVDFEANVIKLILGNVPIGGSSIFYNPEGLYVKISNDEDSPVNEIRRIESASEWANIFIGAYGYQMSFKLLLEEYFSVVPKPYRMYAPLDLNFYALASIIRALLEYSLDIEESECFIDDDTIVYIKDSGDMIRLEDITIEQDTSDIPIYEINSSVFDGEIGNASSKVILPAEGIEPYSGLPELSTFGLDPNYRFVNDQYGVRVNGMFLQSDQSLEIPNQPTITGSASNVFDRDRNTIYKHNVYIHQVYPVNYQHYYAAFEIKLPQIGEDVVFDNVYLAVRCISTLSSDDYEGLPPYCDFDSHFFVAHRAFYNMVHNPIDKTGINYRYPVYHISVPDNYYLYNKQDTKNKYFYYTQDTTNFLTGYKLFELSNITSREIFNNIYEFLIVFVRIAKEYGPTDIYDTIEFNEVAFIFEKNITIGNEIYA